MCKNIQDRRIVLRLKPFHDPLPKPKLETFSDINKPRVAKSAQQGDSWKQTTSYLAIWFFMQQEGSCTRDQCWPKKGEVESRQLPPCEDCLFMHSLRANYHAGVWLHPLEECPSIPNPSGHEWCYAEDGRLTICWMTGSPAPAVATEFLSCKCTSVCRLPNCQCVANGLKCTVTYKL